MKFAMQLWHIKEDVAESHNHDSLKLPNNLEPMGKQTEHRSNAQNML